MPMTSLVLHQVKEVGAVTQKEINTECKTLTYISLALTILGLVMVRILHYRKSKLCRGCMFSNAVKIMLFISDVQYYVPIKIVMIRGIHIFRRDCTTQVISCKPWSPNSVLTKNMWTYLELEGKSGTQPPQAPTDLAKPLHHRKPQLKKAADKRRTETLIKRQCKVRLIEKSLPEPKAVATMAASTPTSVVGPTTTTTKPSPIPVDGIQPGSGQNPRNPQSHKKVPGRRSQFTLNCDNPPIAQHPMAYYHHHIQSPTDWR